MENIIKILLAEDNPADVSMIREMLEQGDFELSCAECLSETLQQTDKAPYDLILLNPDLPDSQGCDTFCRLHEHARHIPVVILSKSEDIELALKTIRKGAQDFLVMGKTDGDILSRAIHYAIERHSARLLYSEDASRTKNEFLASMSHEIRTPISGIIGMTEMMLDTDTEKKQREDLEIIKNSAMSLLTIINDILDFSKIEADRMELLCEDFDFASLMDIIIRSFIVQSKAKGVDLRLNIMPDVPRHLHGDPHRLRQILNNLISNALKFTEKGEVVLEIGKLTQADSSVTLLFSVRDTGIGIPENRLPDLFQSFCQIPNSCSKACSGTGLGLAISKKLVEMMGGNIWAESREGQGSIFYFVSQFEAVTKDEAESPDKTEHTDRNPGKIPLLSVLLAEDEIVNQKFISYFLEREGHSVFVASDGKEVLSALNISKFDLILMDVNMPGMGGLEATKTIRNAEQSHNSHHIPIIALTAYAMNGDRERFIEAGMDDYVSKPVSRETLKAVIASVMNSHERISEPSPVISGKKVLNREDLLRRCGGDQKIIERCYTIFAADIGNHKKQFEIAIEDKNIEAVRQHGHRLKGASANIGAETCNIFAAKIEEAAMERDLKQIRMLYFRLEKELTNVQSLLEQEHQYD
ncbi:response regulator [Desulfococcaceae bacterium HSG8]|nr:response regulator [Desulfococcaceae bacterium HSG8]